jgi:hypothetical protein
LRKIQEEQCAEELKCRQVFKQSLAAYVETLFASHCLWVVELSKLIRRETSDLFKDVREVRLLGKPRLKRDFHNRQPGVSQSLAREINPTLTSELTDGGPVVPAKFASHMNRMHPYFAGDLSEPERFLETTAEELMNLF